MDRPVAALIEDLRSGDADETLIVLGGEFGRTFSEGRTAKGQILGRDHFPDCYSMMLAGGGIRGGSPMALRMNCSSLQRIPSMCTIFRQLC